ncbi:MAG: type II pantothenate kinase [Clostridia bacterium]|nr:type II pantothenate kinase [Clostridia bacterium]
MGIIVGIDVGGSTTKIAGVKDGAVISPMMAKASDPVASLYGAFGKFTSENGIALTDIEHLMVTGVGSAFAGDTIYALPTTHVTEFVAIGRGGSYLSGLDKAIVVSMGTGTALVYCENGKSVHLGGTGVGGGTLVGLAGKLLGTTNVSAIEEMAAKGHRTEVDLSVNDMTEKNIGPTLHASMTASNFGKISDLAKKEDIAAGLLNMIYETVGVAAIFAAREKNVRDIVLTGRLSALDSASRTFRDLGDTFGVNFVLPRDSEYATVIGAALTYFDRG